MKYITGIHALNLNCSLETSGDWHQSGIQWKNLKQKESTKSIFGDWGIELNSHVPMNPGTFHVANHIRACLDLLDEGNFGYAQGMRHELIDNDKYTPIIFEKVLSLRDSTHWLKINRFMGMEYGIGWLDFLEENKHGRLAKES